MFDWLVRRWRVEVALFRCYFEAWRREDTASFTYCKDKKHFCFFFLGPWHVAIDDVVGLSRIIAGFTETAKNLKV